MQAHGCLNFEDWLLMCLLLLNEVHQCTQFYLKTCSLFNVQQQCENTSAEYRCNAALTPVSLVIVIIFLRSEMASTTHVT